MRSTVRWSTPTAFMSKCQRILTRSPLPQRGCHDDRVMLGLLGAGAAYAHGLEHGGGAVGERREEGAEQSERHAVIVATAAGRGLRVRGSAGTCS